MHRKDFHFLTEEYWSQVSKQHEPKQTHFAALVKRNKVIAIAENSDRKYQAHLKSMHAEKAVIFSLGDLQKLKGCTLFVWRSTCARQQASSKPCANCELFLKKMMRTWGLEKVVFTP